MMFTTLSATRLRPSDGGRGILTLLNPARHGRFWVPLVRTLNYVTNYVVPHVPSYTIRHGWYRRVVGVRMDPSATVNLGCYFWFYGPGATRRADITIGRNSRINRNCTVDLRGGLTIGDNVSVSANATILTSAGMSNSRRSGEAKPVVIEDNVWIGTHAIVMPGVTVGRGAVVGAGAVVLADVAPLSIVFGSPARPTGKRSEDDAEYDLEGPPPLFE